MTTLISRSPYSLGGRYEGQHADVDNSSAVPSTPDTYISGAISPFYLMAHVVPWKGGKGPAGAHQYHVSHAIHPFRQCIMQSDPSPKVTRTSGNSTQNKISKEQAVEKSQQATDAAIREADTAKDAAMAKLVDDQGRVRQHLPADGLMSFLQMVNESGKNESGNGSGSGKRLIVLRNGSIQGPKGSSGNGSGSGRGSGRGSGSGNSSSGGGSGSGNRSSGGGGQPKTKWSSGFTFYAFDRPQPGTRQFFVWTATGRVNNSTESSTDSGSSSSSASPPSSPSSSSSSSSSTNSVDQGASAKANVTTSNGGSRLMADAIEKSGTDAERFKASSATAAPWRHPVTEEWHPKPGDTAKTGDTSTPASSGDDDVPQYCAVTKEPPPPDATRTWKLSFSFYAYDIAALSATTTAAAAPIVAGGGAEVYVDYYREQKLPATPGCDPSWFGKDCAGFKTTPRCPAGGVGGIGPGVKDTGEAAFCSDHAHCGADGMCKAGRKQFGEQRVLTVIDGAWGGAGKTALVDGCDVGWGGIDCSVVFLQNCPRGGRSNEACSGHGLCGGDGKCKAARWVDGLRIAMVETKGGTKIAPGPSAMYPYAARQGDCKTLDDVGQRLLNGCDIGWKGEACDESTNDIKLFQVAGGTFCPSGVNPDTLEAAQCSGSGVCTPAGTCTCDRGSMGIACDIEAPVRCPGTSNHPETGQPVECTGHGSCAAGTASCDCMYPFVGEACATDSVQLQHSCPPVGGQPCSNHGVCGEDFRCKKARLVEGVLVPDMPVVDGCETGWTGDACNFPCAQPFCPRIQQQACNGHGKCVSPASPHCRCEPTWCGVACGVSCDLMQGHVDVNGCPVVAENGLRCNGKGTCVPNEVFCSCIDGWKGSDCSLRSSCLGTMGEGVSVTHCSGHGICSNHTVTTWKGNEMKFQCDCDLEWCGKDCGQDCGTEEEGEDGRKVFNRLGEEETEGEKSAADDKVKVDQGALADAKTALRDAEASGSVAVEAKAKADANPTDKGAADAATATKAKADAGSGAIAEAKDKVKSAEDKLSIDKDVAEEKGKKKKSGKKKKKKKMHGVCAPNFRLENKADCLKDGDCSMQVNNATDMKACEKLKDLAGRIAMWDSDNCWSPGKTPQDALTNAILLGRIECVKKIAPVRDQFEPSISLNRCDDSAYSFTKFGGCKSLGAGSHKGEVVVDLPHRVGTGAHAFQPHRGPRPMEPTGNDDFSPHPTYASKSWGKGTGWAPTGTPPIVANTFTAPALLLEVEAKATTNMQAGVGEEVEVEVGADATQGSMMTAADQVWSRTTAKARVAAASGARMPPPCPMGWKRPLDLALMCRDYRIADFLRNWGAEEAYPDLIYPFMWATIVNPFSNAMAGMGSTAIQGYPLFQPQIPDDITSGDMAEPPEKKSGYLETVADPNVKPPPIGDDLKPFKVLGKRPLPVSDVIPQALLPKNFGGDGGGGGSEDGDGGGDPNGLASRIRAQGPPPGFPGDGGDGTPIPGEPPGTFSGDGGWGPDDKPAPPGDMFPDASPLSGAPCPHCDHIAASAEALDAHIKAKHPTLAIPIPCVHCSYIAESPVTLEAHMKSAHPEICGASVCPVCGFQAASADALDAHLLAAPSPPHHKQSAAPCPVCGKTYLSAESLDAHIKCAHPTAAENPIKCPLCPFEALSPETLAMHSATAHPTMPTCSICGYAKEKERWRWRTKETDADRDTERRTDI